MYSPPHTLLTSYRLTLPTAYTPHLILIHLIDLHSSPRTHPASIIHSPPHTFPASYRLTLTTAYTPHLILIHLIHSLPNLIHSSPRTHPASIIHSPPHTSPASYTPCHNDIRLSPDRLRASYTPHLILTLFIHLICASYTLPHTLPTSYTPRLIHSPSYTPHLIHSPL